MKHATTKPFRFSTKQWVLLALMVPLVPFLFAVTLGVAAMRAGNPTFRLDSMPQPRDLGLAVALALAFVAVRSVALDVFKPVARVALPPAFRGNDFRVDRFATSLFKLVYFTAIVVVGYWIQRDAVWFPPSLGGSGAVSAAFSTAPNHVPSAALKLYMLVEFAYLFHNLIFVVFWKPFDRDTMDFVIHDHTGMLLIGSAYLNNYLAIGATITFLNDVADVVHYLLLVASDSRRQWALVAMTGVFLVGWGYTRLVVFPLECLWTMILETPALDPNVSMLYLLPTNLMLGLLLGLQVYWYQMLTGKAYRVFRQTRESPSRVRAESVAEKTN